jgi:hypothetical protein
MEFVFLVRNTGLWTDDNVFLLSEEITFPPNELSQN